MPGATRPLRVEEFDAMYASTPPWDIGRPQPAFLELAENGALRGEVLDVGCGTGEHALMASRLGLPATGIDAAPTAIDALDLGSLGERFDTVLDSGLFHIFDDDDRGRYVDSLRTAISPGARYFMLCFSDRQPGDWGPRRVTEAEIRQSFVEGWEIDAIEGATMDITIDPNGVFAWRSAITRT